MDISSLSPATLTAVGGAITTVFGAIGSWMVAKRQSKKLDDDATTSAFKELAEANRTFRAEVKNDLQAAQERIAVLEAAINNKDRIILELQTQIARLQFELDRMKTGRNGQ